MNSSTKQTELWQVFLVLLAAPLFQALLFFISGVSLATFSRFSFIPGMVTLYIFLGIVMWSLRQGGKRLADIGLVLNRWGREALLGLGLGIVIFVLMSFLIFWVEKFLPSAVSREPRPLWGALLFGFALLTAFAPIEEIIWRGYAITILRKHLGRTWAAVLIASAAFGLLHWWGGLALIINSSIAGILFSLLYLWRKNLVAPIVCHFVTDFPLFLLMLFPRPPLG